VFADFCRIGACTLAPRIPRPDNWDGAALDKEDAPSVLNTISIREDEYMSVTKSYDRQELNVFAKALGDLQLEMADPDNEFVDVLGPYYEEVASKSSKKWGGEFYTPQEVGELMTRMLFDPETIIEKGHPVTMQEPCSGAGGIILSLAKQFSPAARNDETSYVDLLRVTAIDINPIACDMTYINTSMWGIPTNVLQGNVLGDLSELKGWKNAHWYRVGEDDRIAMEARVNAMRNFLKSVDEHDAREKHRKENPRPPLADITINHQGNQVSFDFE